MRNYLADTNFNRTRMTLIRRIYTDLYKIDTRFFILFYTL